MTGKPSRRVLSGATMDSVKGRRLSPTMAAIVADVGSEASARTDPNAEPGRFNRHGQLFDRQGRLLERTKSKILPAEALGLVEDGADVAFEGCGCGGWDMCQPSWYDLDQRTAMTAAGPPRFVRGHNAPTFIDVWTNPESTVVFLHGDIEWAGLLV